MTKRHFEAIAAALLTSRPEHEDVDFAHVNQMSQWRSDVRAIAEVLLAHNPRFDARFYEACGYETTEPEAKEIAS